MKKRKYKHSYLSNFWLGVALGLFLSGPLAHCEDIPSMIKKEALRQGLDPAIALSIATIESGMNPRAVGPKKEIGLFQILPRYSPVPKKQLFNPRINARIGIMKLIEARDRCAVNENMTWVTCFNQGWRHPKYPTLHPYYKRFMIAWAHL